MKRIFFIIFSSMLLLLQIVPVKSYAAEAIHTRQINVVYDDSGSMYIVDGQTGNPKVDTWCQAKYSMEVFASMLGDNDKMNVYYMSDYTDGTGKGARIVLDGKDGAAANVKKIHDQRTTSSGTPFDSVLKAYSDLESTAADEKWLVVLTDGYFNDPGLNLDDYFANKSDDTKVMFMSIGEDSAEIRQDENRETFFTRAKNNSQILSEITGICTRIFNSNKLNINTSSNSFEFDVPMSELTIFAQGANVQINGIKNEVGTLIPTTGNPVSVMYSECDADNQSNEPTKDLVGSIAKFQGDLPEGKYTADVSGAETIEIYYKPNVEVAAYMTDKDGNEVTDLSDLEAGDYTISFGFVKGGTKERLGQSDLLGNVSFEGFITNNGNRHENVYHDGDIVTIEEGDLSIDANAYFLDYNSVSTHLDYSIYKNKNITFSVIDNPETVITSKGIENDTPVKLQAKIDGSDITPEQWDQMEVPSIKFKEGSNSFNLNEPIVEKSDDVGVYDIHLSLPDNKTASVTYSDVAYDVDYHQQFGSETWSGTADDTFRLRDTRSWLERNRALVVKLLILVGIIALILGYMPFIKHYLPKSLKSKPYIRCRSSVPGESRKDSKGEVTKTVISTVIPYIPQRGYIRFFPKHVTGVAKLEVKGIRGRRMSITNFRRFENKDITFDGESIDKSTKSFQIGAGTSIRLKRNEKTYICNLNQDSKN